MSSGGMTNDDRLSVPAEGVRPVSDDVDDDELLLYLYEKSSTDSRGKCYDCVSMGKLVATSSSEAVPDRDRELMSRSTEQIYSKALSLATSGSMTAAASQVPGVVRSCRSQENYMELADMICVDIDIDDNLASSVDALHYRESVASRTSDSSGSVETVELLEGGDEGAPVTTQEDERMPDEMAEQIESSDQVFNSSSYEQQHTTQVRRLRMLYSNRSNLKGFL